MTRQQEAAEDPSGFRLEARARMALGEDDAAEQALQKLAPEQAVAVRIELARRLRTIAPLRALGFLRRGIEDESFAGLSDEVASSLLAHGADAARLAGADSFALASYRRFLSSAEGKDVNVKVLSGALAVLPAAKERGEAWERLRSEQWALARRMAEHSIGVRALQERMDGLPRLASPGEVSS